MSVSTLERKIDSAQKESSALLKKNYSWQEDVDTLLDRMNEVNGLLSSIHKILLNLTFEIERDFKTFKKTEKGHLLIKNLADGVSKMLLLVYKSDLFPGVKSTYYLIKKENEYLRELYNDRKVGLALEADDELDDLMKKTLDELNKP